MNYTALVNGARDSSKVQSRTSLRLLLIISNDVIKSTSGRTGVTIGLGSRKLGLCLLK
jgi:hypothetical protein